MTASTDINIFMARFHAVESALGLFDQRIDEQPWWDTVRFDVCYYLYDCLSGLAYSSAHSPRPRSRRLGVLRRFLQREAMFARARLTRPGLLVLRGPRAAASGERIDAVLDPITALLEPSATIIDILPRRYHLPDPDPQRWPGAMPAVLPATITTLLTEMAVDQDRAAPLEALVHRGRHDFAAGIAGYRRIFDRMRPRAVLLAGVDKPLCFVARERGVPVVEAQHGLIGFGHPAYSYPDAVRFADQPGFPDLFLTFSDFWSRETHYPAARQAVIGADHLATGVAPLREPLSDIMVVSADIYHAELAWLVRDLAHRLPDRRIVLKLHPNQIGAEAAIRAAFIDLPNLAIGSATTPALGLLDRVSHLVAVQSTVVYEALQQGRRVCILARHDYHLHDDVLERPDVSVVRSADELAAALEIPAGNGTSPIFFERFNVAKTRALIADLVNRG